MPYDVEFSLTRNSSRTPSLASHRASSSTSVGRRLTNEPRKDGMAQKVQRRSQPEASLSGAIGPVVKRVRWTPLVGPDETAAARSTGEMGSSRRRSCGVCGCGRSPATIARSRAAMSG